MTLILTTLMTISSLLIMVNHPLSMGLILMLQTILVSMMLGNMTLKFWYSFILFLVMVGGLLVLFIYMTSIASNQKFKFSWKVVLLITLMMLNIHMFNKTNFQPTMINFNFTISKFFTLYSSGMMIMLMFYLMITMIAVVKIAKTNFGPLRQK